MPWWAEPSEGNAGNFDNFAGVQGLVAGAVERGRKFQRWELAGSTGSLGGIIGALASGNLSGALAVETLGIRCRHPAHVVVRIVRPLPTIYRSACVKR